jgi:hypothetical protein
MPVSPIFDVAIGLIFVFLLIALVSSQLGDNISLWLRWRAKQLETGIRSYITGEQHLNLFDDLYSNPLIQSIVPTDSIGTKILQRIPGVKNLVYASNTAPNIPAKTFSLALVDLLVPDMIGQTTLDKLQASIATLPATTPMRGPLLSLVNTANGDIDKFRTGVENWFDSTMEKTTQIYQRNMFVLAFLLSLAVAVFLNVDAVSIGVKLWHDTSLRAALVGAAAKYAQGSPDQDQALQQLNSLDLPIGWQATIRPSITLVPSDWLPKPGDPAPIIFTRMYVFKLLGWLITGFAGAQGAPFWFDLLQKLTK